VFPSKYRIHAILILVALVIIFLPKYNESPDSEKAAAAQVAAEKFYALVDADQFAASWQNCAPLLKEKVTEQEWVRQLSKTREVGGPLIKRTLKDMTYSTSAKDSPEGEYILLIYDTTFKTRPDSSENLTVMLDKDQIWRVTGYFIQ